MNEKNYLYEYAVVRYVPAVEREEFVNIGLIMMCKSLRWIKSRIILPIEKIKTFKSELSLDSLTNQVVFFENIANGCKSGGPIALLPVEERFRWLSSVKSACIQSSRPHPGITDNLDREFELIFQEQVL